MNMIGHQAVANQQHLMQRKVLSQQIQIHSAVRVALQKKTATIAALGHMVRYSNGVNPVTLIRCSIPIVNPVTAYLLQKIQPIVFAPGRAVSGE
jgi:hypothetical protein